MSNEPAADDALQASHKQISEMMVALVKAEQAKDNLQGDLNELSFASMCQSIQMVWMLSMLPPDLVVYRSDGVDVRNVEFAEGLQDALDSIEPQSIVDEARAELIPGYKV